MKNLSFYAFSALAILAVYIYFEPDFTGWFWIVVGTFVLLGMRAMAIEDVKLLRALVILGTISTMVLALGLLGHLSGLYFRMFETELPVIFPGSAFIALIIFGFCSLFGQIFIINDQNADKKEAIRMATDEDYS